MRRITVPVLATALCTASTVWAAGTDIAADTLTRRSDGVVVAEGNVIIHRKGETLKADEIRYDAANKQLEAEGHVKIESNSAEISAESGTLHTEDKTGELHKATAILKNGERLSADRFRRIDDNHFSVEGVTFTTCPPDAQTWLLRASRADVDQEEGVMKARNVRFELAGLPVFYSPYMSQPLRRKSGLLLPFAGTSKQRGTELALPLYLAPAPNWDATITPHSMTARGTMAETEIRHASDKGYEELQWDSIHDRQTAYNRQRLRAKVTHALPGNWQLNSNIDHVSDHQYLTDFSTRPEDVAARFLTSTAGLNWQGDLGTASLFGQTQQDLALPSDATTLQILPRLQSDLVMQGQHLDLHFEQQSTRFARNSGLDGWRVVLHPWLELPWQSETGAATTTLRLGARHTRYWLNGMTAGNPAIAKQTNYEASLTSRVDFERISANRHWRHTISPVLRYDYATAPAQAALPNFDSAFGNLTIQNLMNGNRFSGQDRFERMHRISALLETALQNKAKANQPAREVLQMRFGAAYNIRRQTVDPNLKQVATRPFSNLVGDMMLSPLDGIRLSGGGQYNPVDHYWATAHADLMLSHPYGHRLDVHWQQTDRRYATASKLISTNALIQLAQRWQATGRWQYDPRLKLTQQASAGIHYQHPCWDLTIEGYRIHRTGTVNSSDSGYRFLLGFKGLGSVGS